uniref:Uncharacterized protein n=1 Tax=Faecalibaculum rodentium TaxID=1702221 RepID=A0A140DT36_9FIRM|nr:hypothetical protein AALO17_06790 [Faecalibaculum rodentium]
MEPRRNVTAYLFSAAAADGRVCHQPLWIRAVWYNELNIISERIHNG